jgi:hypothetical protein
MENFMVVCVCVVDWLIEAEVEADEKSGNIEIGRVGQ